MRFLYLLLFLTSAHILNSQTVDTNEPLFRELGLRFSGLNDFNIFYKKAKMPDKIIRHRFIVSRLSYSSTRKDADLTLGYAVGKEKRKPIADKLSIIYGPEYSMTLAYSNSDGVGGDRIGQLNLNPAIGYILGFQYDFSEQFCLAVEVIPAVGGTFSIFSYDENQFNVFADLSTNRTALSAMYRF